MSTVQRHPYVDDGTTDVYGKGRCATCGTPASNVRHELPSTSEEAAEIDARRIGERD